MEESKSSVQHSIQSADMQRQPKILRNLPPIKRHVRQHVNRLSFIKVGSGDGELLHNGNLAPDGAPHSSENVGKVSSSVMTSDSELNHAAQ